jgi:hypothetical protein
MTETVTTSEAVRIFGAHPGTIRLLILTRRVFATKDVDGRWRISRSDLENWNRNRRKRTRWTPRPEEVGATA